MRLLLRPGISDPCQACQACQAESFNDSVMLDGQYPSSNGLRRNAVEIAFAARNLLGM